MAFGNNSRWFELWAFMKCNRQGPSRLLRKRIDWPSSDQVSLGHLRLADYDLGLVGAAAVHA